MTTATLVRLILLLPLAGALVNGLAGLFFPGYRQQKGLIGAIAVASVAVPFFAAVALFVGFGGQAEVVSYFTWMEAGRLSVGFDYRVDQLSLLMTLIVTGVGALIHVYSLGYMKEDAGYWRYFAYLNLFIFAMLNLVLAENLVVLFLGWEGVGLCSYLLIGFWYDDLKNTAAANKAFIANRIGDAAFLVGLFVLFWAVMELPGLEGAAFGLDFTTLLAPATVAGLAGPAVALAMLLLFIGATGKSAQIPLYVWLPDAMAGPTPVSALIHAATMVTSGLYLLARLSPLVIQTPWLMALIGTVGAVTAIVAATIAITQTDIKKVLAYSTVSQLGYMFLAAGVGAYSASIFHVMTHAFFKGCLFLGAGAVIHAMHHVEHEVAARGRGHLDPQNLHTMGGLKRYLPFTRWTFLIATLAIAGIPLLSGFFSKDEILWRAYEYGVLDGHFWATVMWIVGLVTALLTAVYMTRCYALAFEGDERWPESIDVKPHEVPATMWIPLVVLAGLSAVAGFVNLPAVLGGGWLHHFLVDGGAVMEPVLQPHGPEIYTTEWILLAVGAGVAILGVFIGWMGLGRFGGWARFGPAADRRFEDYFGWVYRVWQNRYGADAAVDGAVVRPVTFLAEKGLRPFDERAVDGAVRGVSGATRGLGGGLGRLQDGLVQHYAIVLTAGVALVLLIVVFA